MVALTYGITSSGEHGWSNSYTLGTFAVAAVMLSVFIISQSRITEPMLPLRLFKDRNRVGSYLSMLLLAFGPMGTFYLLTLFMQHILQYSPVETGLSWLPFGIGIILSAGIASKLVTRFSPRIIASVGMLIGAVAALWLAGVGDISAYFSFLLPGIFFTAFGFGMGVISLTLTAVSGVPAQDSGIASALLNASQQIGVAMGLAVLSTVSVGISSGKVPDALTSLYQGRESGNQAVVQNASEAIVSGYSGGLIVGGIALFIAAVIAFLMINAEKHKGSEAGIG
jgi:predicted MFS family arabinose efflux permease